MGSWVRLIFLALGAAVLILLIARTNVSALRGAARDADAGLLAIALALVVANIVLKAVRWRFMASQLADPPLGLRQAAAAILAGVAAGSLTPARGVELAKPLLLRRSRGVALSISTAAVIVERLLDGAGLIVLFGISFVLLPAGRAAVFRPVFAAIGLLVAAIGLLLTIPSRFSGPLTRRVAALPLPHALRVRAARLVEAFFQGLLVWRRPDQLWVAVALSILAATIESLRLSVVMGAMHAPVSVVQAMFTFSLANLVAVLSFIPGGVGITELSMAAIIGFIAPGSPPPAALTAAVLVDRLLSFYFVVLAGSLVLLVTGASRADSPGNPQT